ncbi:MAG: type II 3-dehydroquinate dehydratase [bacterium]
MSRHVLVIHGANLDLLGTREPEIYGTTTLADIRAAIDERAAAGGHRVTWVQSNHEGDLVDAIGRAIGSVDGILINPGGFTHTSVAIRDALLAVGVPTIEVHLSNIHAREEFRKRSLIADVVTAQVSGLGAAGTVVAFGALIDLLERRELTGLGGR